MKSYIRFLQTSLPQELASEFNHAYKQLTIHTRKNKFPPETIVKFTSSFTRDAILQAIQDQDLELKGNKIKVLKEIPWRIRQQRKEYYLLIKLLTDKKIQYNGFSPKV